MMVERAPMQMCPMAETCKGMIEKPFSGVALVVPGIVLIVLGVLVVIEPRILAWLVAVALIIMGIAMLMAAKFMRGMGRRFQDIP